MAVNVSFEYYPTKIIRPNCLVGLFKNVEFDGVSRDVSADAAIGGDGYLSHSVLMYAANMDTLAIRRSFLGHEKFQVFGDLSSSRLALSIELSGCTQGLGSEELCVKTSLIAIELAKMLGRQMESVFPAPKNPREYYFLTLGCKTLRNMTNNGTTFPYQD